MELQAFIKTVSAIAYENGEEYILNIMFEVPDASFDIIGGIEDASRDYILTTKQGRMDFAFAGGKWNLSDFDLNVPEDYCEKHGFRKLVSSMADQEVGWEFQLVDESEIKTLLGNADH